MGLKIPKCITDWKGKFKGERNKDNQPIALQIMREILRYQRGDNTSRYTWKTRIINRLV